MSRKRGKKKKGCCIIPLIFLLAVVIAGAVTGIRQSGHDTEPSSASVSASADSGASGQASAGSDAEHTRSQNASPQSEPLPSSKTSPAEGTSENAAASSGSTDANSGSNPGGAAAFDISQVPPYSGKPFCDINGDVPYFTDDELTTTPFESYSDLDELGRCGVAYACVGPETLPTEKRGSISEVRPTGWHTVKYDGIDGNYLYNRCHLIGYQLTGQNANEKNLITGTRYLNVQGMLENENSVAMYIETTGYHVLYRVTPIFEGDNLLASGVLMEAKSVEDTQIQYCEFCYNVQPGITIDYATGDSSGPEFTGSEKNGSADKNSGSSEQKTNSGNAGSSDHAETSDNAGSSENTDTADAAGDSNNTGNSSGRNNSSSKGNGSGNEAFPDYETPNQEANYIVNTNTGKFHLPSCPSAKKTKPKNRMDWFGTREELIEQGYEPCKNCNP